MLLRGYDGILIREFNGKFNTATPEFPAADARALQALLWNVEEPSNLLR
jgi:hypothetical protein